MCLEVVERSRDPTERSPHSATAYEESHFLLNVGGRSFRFRPDIILSCREDSLLSTLISAEHSQRLMLTDSFNAETGEYYLERNSKVASHVIDYFCTGTDRQAAGPNLSCLGTLHKPSLNEICPERFIEELNFWRLYKVQFAPCCAPILNTTFSRKDLSEEEHEFDGVTTVL